MRKEVVFVLLLIGSLFCVGLVSAAPYAAIGEDCTGVYWSNKNFGTSTRPATLLSSVISARDRAVREMKDLNERLNDAIADGAPADWIGDYRDAIIEKDKEVGALNVAIQLRDEYGADNSDGSTDKDGLLAASRAWCGGDCYSCGVKMLSWSGWSSTGILCGFVPENKSVENACDNGWRCDGRGNCITDECRVTKAYWMNASGSEVWSVIPTTRVKMIAETADCDNGEVIIFNVSHKDGYSNFLEPSTLPPYETSGVVSNGRVERSFIGTIAHGAISVYEFEARPASGDVSEAKISPELLVSESECFRNDLKYDCMRCVYSTLEGDWIPEPYRRDHDQCHMCRPVLERSGANIPLVTKSVPIASDILAMCDVFNIIFNDEGTVHGFNKFTSITEYVPVPLSGDPCNQKLDSGGLAYGKCKCGECVEPEACDSSNKCGSTCKDDFTFLRWQCIDGKCVNPVEENRRSKKVFCWQGQEKLLRNKNEPSFLKNYAVGSLPLNLQKISGTIPGTEFIPGGGVGVAFKWAPKGRVPTREESTQAVFSVSAVTYGLNLNLGKIKKEYCDPIVGLFCGGSK